MLAPGQTWVEGTRRGEWGQPNVSSESGIWGIYVCFWSGVRRWSDILQSLRVSAEVTDEMLLHCGCFCSYTRAPRPLLSWWVRWCPRVAEISGGWQRHPSFWLSGVILLVASSWRAKCALACGFWAMLISENVRHGALTLAKAFDICTFKMLSLDKTLPFLASDGPPLTLLGWKVTAVTLPGSSEGALFTPKAKHSGAEWWACLATPARLPRILAGRQRAQDQGSPCTNTDRVVGHLGGSHKGFHPKETHFKGMCLFLYLQRSPHSVLCSSAEPWIDRQVSSTRLFCFGAASLCTDAAVGRSGWVSAHIVFCYNLNIN